MPAAHRDAAVRRFHRAVRRAGLGMHAGALEVRARGIGQQQLHRVHVGDRAHGARDHAIRLGLGVGHFQRFDQLVAEGAAAGLGAQPRQHALHGVGQQVDHAREPAHFVGAVRVAAIVHVAGGERLRDFADVVNRVLDGTARSPRTRASRRARPRAARRRSPTRVTMPERSASASTRVSTRCRTPRMRVMASRKPVSSAARRGSRSAKAQAVAPPAPPPCAHVVFGAFEVLRCRAAQTVGDRGDFRRRRQRPGELELRAQRADQVC